MRQIERQRHVVFCFVAGISEHHALVAGTLLAFVLTVNAALDVLALLMYGVEHTTRIPVELIFRLCISYSLYRLAGNGLQVDIHIAAHLAGNDNLSCGYKRLNSHAGLVVVSQELVEYCV